MVTLVNSLNHENNVVYSSAVILFHFLSKFLTGPQVLNKVHHDDVFKVTNTGGIISTKVL